MKALSASLRQATPACTDLPAANHENPAGRSVRGPATWIGLHFPRLVLQALDPPEGLPFVIIEERSGIQVIHAACDIAQAEGIMPGMPLNAAYTLCRNLAVRLRDPKREEQALHQAAWRATGFTPTVSLAPPDTLLLEVSASFRLFDGLDTLRQQLVKAFETGVVISVAPTPTAAWLLADNGLARTVSRPGDLKSALGELTLSHCGLDPKLVQRLSKCGLRALRELWRLPPADLARRFGPNLVTFLDRACGAQPDPRPVHVPDIRFREQLELAVQTENCQTLEAGAEKLFARARDFLQSRRAVTESVRLELHHVEQRERDRDCTTLTVRLQQPDREPRRFLSQLGELLGRTTLPAPIDRLVLCIDRVIPWCGQHQDLFHERQGDPQAWAELVEGLAARLGEPNVYSVHDVPDHRPEKAWRSDQPTPNPVSTRDIPAVAESQPGRPLWLLPTPQPLARSANIPTRVGDTERIEAGWWDNGDCRRDYYRVTTRQGARWWVFRDLASTQPDSPRWYLHGLFA